MAKEQKQYNKEYTEKVSKKQNEFKNYVKSFKADVKRKKKAYRSYAKKLQKEKILTNKNED